MSKYLKSLAAGLILSSGGLIGLAQAAEAEKSGAALKPAQVAASTGGTRQSSRRLMRLDRDKDGAVSKAEYLAPPIATHKEFDTNKDGFVDEAEIVAHLQEPAQFRTKRLLKRIDGNRDGKVTREEFEQGPRETFANRDINSDGKLNAEDRPPATGGGFGWFNANRSARMGLGAGRANRPDTTLETVLEKTKAGFDKLDANGDGVIDTAEIEKQSAARIEYSKKRMLHLKDENKDGKVSQEENNAFPSKKFATLDLNDDGQIDSKDFPANPRKLWFSR